MRTSEKLKGAARALREQGWGRSMQGLCAVMAIGAAVGADTCEVYSRGSEQKDAMRALLEVACPARLSGPYIHLAGAMSGAIANWNDIDAKDAAEVIDALERAAVIEEARESQVREIETRQPAQVSL